MIGMAATMPDFVHGLNLFLEGDYVLCAPKPNSLARGCGRDRVIGELAGKLFLPSARTGYSRQVGALLTEQQVSSNLHMEKGSACTLCMKRSAFWLGLMSECGLDVWNTSARMFGLGLGS
ncbi:hypothetical protein [Mesorhizobium caraganae]|uniref:hypothetical protein n=1 Tax=Mesorhizobium caraganae TaxID=483206 RepID=UPI003ECFE9E8